jgi:hypothetical protein
MIMTPGVRKLALTAHITSTVGWLGAIAGFLALAVAGLTSPDAQLVRAVYLAMELTGWYAIVPLCLASLVTGLVMSLGTPWRLFRHYWDLVKFLLTIVSALILFMYTQTLSHLGGGPQTRLYPLTFCGILPPSCTPVTLCWRCW